MEMQAMSVTNIYIPVGFTMCSILPGMEFLW